MRRGFRLLMAAGFMAVACGAADARCGDLDGVLTLPGYDVPSLSLDMPSLDMPALSPVYGGGAVVPGRADEDGSVAELRDVKPGRVVGWAARWPDSGR